MCRSFVRRLGCVLLLAVSFVPLYAAEDEVKPIPGIGPTGKISKLHTGFKFTEGPASWRAQPWHSLAKHFFGFGTGQRRRLHADLEDRRGDGLAVPAIALRTVHKVRMTESPTPVPGKDANTNVSLV